MVSKKSALTILALLLLLVAVVAIAQEKTPLPASNRGQITAANASEVVEISRLGRGYITGIDWSPVDDHLVAIAMGSGVRLYNVDTLETPPFILPYDGWSITGVTFSSDGLLLASGDERGAIYIWNVPDGTLLQTIDAHKGAIWEVAFSPDGTTLASAGEQSVRLWDVATGEVQGVLRHNGDLRAVAFSPDGLYLATATDDSLLRVWDVATGSTVSVVYPKGKVLELAFAPDGAVLAAGGFLPGRYNVALWNIAAGALIGVPKLLQTNERFDINSSPLDIGLHFSSDAQSLYVTPMRDISIWDVSTGQMTAESIAGYEYRGYYFAFSPDASRIAVATNLWAAVLKPLPPKTDAELQLPPTPTAINCRLDGTCEVKAEASELVSEVKSIYSIGFTADSNKVLFGDGHRDVYAWNLSTGSLETTDFLGEALEVNWGCSLTWGNRILIPEDMRRSSQNYVVCTHEPLVSPDDKYEAFCELGTEIVLVNKETGLETRDNWYGDSERQIGFSPNSQYLIGWQDREGAPARLWNTTDGELWVLPSRLPPVFNADGSVIAVTGWEGFGRGGLILLYDANTHQLLNTLFGFNYIVNHLVFSPDGTLLAAAGGQEHFIHLYGVFNK